jgi:hypothetical protein
MRHVKAGEIHQLERSKPKTAGLAHHTIDVFKGAHAFADDAQCLGAKGAARMIDDESRGVFGAHRGVAESF